MNSIKRIFVEKKEGYNIEANHMLKDLRDNLGITSLEKIRILNRYDIEEIQDEDFIKCKKLIFAEPTIDKIYDENFDYSSEFVFAVKYLPGQYDQRADSAMQCIQIVTQKESSTVETAKVYVCNGKLSEEDKTKIKQYSINPVDSMETSLEKPLSLRKENETTEDINSFIGFNEMSMEEASKFREIHGLAMSLEDLLHCQNYFKNKENREPTVTEIRVIDTYWSDHCRHTTFLTKIEDVEFKDGFYKDIIQNAYNLYVEERALIYGNSEKDISLMDIAVMGMKVLKNKGILDNLDESDEINACSIVVDVDVDGVLEKWLVMFKNETHNHPTEIEPFGGAATCLGGAIRDPLSGRSYVYQAMRVTGSGNPNTPVKDTLSGKLPQRKITTVAAQGYSSYGNQIGLATGHVAEIYHDNYVAKRMEIGAVVGAVKKENVRRETPKKGDIIILVGGRTGRDGCGGATGSSKEHTEESILTCGAEVQKGNPPTERKLQRLFRNPNVSKLIKRCNDFGAGGVCVAIGELAEGLTINLDKVTKKYEGLDGTELAISESQERMAVVVKKEDVDLFIKYSEEENVEATPVALVTDNRRLVMTWRNKEIVNISRDFLDTSGVKQKTKIIVESPEKQQANESDSADYWIDNLKDLNVASQKGLVERFDSTIGSGTVLMPFGGKYRLTPSEVMAAKIPLEKGETNTGTVMSFGYNPYISSWSPFHGAVYAVVESVSKIVASGGDFEKIRLTFQEYFERLGNDPLKWQKPFTSLIGSFFAQMMLNIPSIGGKDSMSGTFKDISVPPTLVSFALYAGDISNIISPEFKKSGNHIIRIKTEMDENDLPNFDKLLNNYKAIRKLILGKKIVSAYTIGFGGTAAAISKMSFGNFVGAQINCKQLYNPCYGSFVVEFEGDIDNHFEGIDYELIGKTIDKPQIIVNDKTIKIDEALNSWLKPLDNIFPTGYFEDIESLDLSVEQYSEQNRKSSSNNLAIKIAKPRVFIPVFPGTNCEYDTKKEFEKAGAIVETFVIKNLTVNQLESSIKEMAEKIKSSQIIAIPGGFSAGDEPDGSGKFIAAVFRNPLITEEVMNLIKNKDGLMLGICNGFQALIKLGLLPFGDIRDLEPNYPTLTFNKIGRHISDIVKTKIISNKSPWLWGVESGDIHNIAVSHGEGRFIASEEVVKKLASNNQIATQYVDFEGNPSYDIRYNPNGSYYAIEGITSPDGRILGKMGHSERIGNHLYKNISGNTQQNIFISGVNYFL